MGVRFDRTQVSSVTSRTSDCTQKTDWSGSSPRDRKLAAASRVLDAKTSPLGREVMA